jgi:dTDP-4-dehydrorhamnose reductase
MHHEPDTSPLRVLVTGATGMLGSTLVPTLQARGATVLTLARGGDVSHRVDLRDRARTFDAVAESHPDCIVHLASATNVDVCEQEPQLAYELNVLTSQNVADACCGMDTPPALVHISTDHVYDGEGLHQEAGICIRNHYAMSKLAGEYAALLAPRTTVLRVNFAGRSHCSGRPSFSDWLVQALRSRTAIHVFEDVWFSPLRMATLSEAIWQVAQQPVRGVFNLGCKGQTSKASFARRLASGLQLDAAQLLPVSLRARTDLSRRPLGMGMDSTRFEQVFNYTLPTLEQEATALCMEYANDL